MAEGKIYRVTVVERGGHTADTTLRGTFAQDLSRSHFKDVCASQRTIFACVWVSGPDIPAYQTDTFARDVAKEQMEAAKAKEKEHW